MAWSAWYRQVNCLKLLQSGDEYLQATSIPARYHQYMPSVSSESTQAAAKRFFRRLLRSRGGEPGKIVKDKLRSYGVAHRELLPEPKERLLDSERALIEVPSS